MRAQCPKCQTVLQLEGLPPAGTKIQCGQCGAQFGVASPRPVALKPIVLPPAGGPSQRPAGPVPVAVTEIPEAILQDTVGEAPDADAGPAVSPPKKKKKRFKKARRETHAGVKLVAAVAITVVVLGIVGVILWKSGLFRTRSLIEFNDEMVAILARLGQSGESTMQQAGIQNNPAQAMQQLDRVSSLIATSLADVKRIPPPPEGAAFHGATVQLLERLHKFFKEDIKQAVNMVTAGRQNEAMQMISSGVNELQELETSMVNAQHSFARQNGFKLIEKPFGGAAGPGRNPFAGNPFGPGRR